MKDFLFVFRADMRNMPQRTEEEAKANTQKWMDWVGSIAAQNKLADRGARLEQVGKVVMPNDLITDGPYTEIKESIGGFITVRTESLDEAVLLAKGCPILTNGGNVEVREVSVM